MQVNERIELVGAVATYERVAREPNGGFHFHRGPRCAAA